MLNEMRDDLDDEKNDILNIINKVSILFINILRKIILNEQ